MIKITNPMGKISLTEDYFASLIGNAITSCYGVAGMIPTGKQRIRKLLTRKEYTDTGIVVTGNIDKINVDLYITVMYGVNINAISKSIVHKVKYTVEEATGIQVNKVTVHVSSVSVND